MSDRGYPMEKLNDALFVLTTHKGRIKERLVESTPYFAGFNPAVFSENVELAYGEIYELLTSVSEEAAGDRGSWPASIDALTEEQATELGKRIVHLHHIAELEYWNERPIPRGSAEIRRYSVRSNNS